MKDSLSLVLIVLLVGVVLLSGKSPLISKEQAEQDALNAVGEGKVTLALTEKELGKIVWSVDVTGANHQFEVWVDAHNGAILQVLSQPLTQMPGYLGKQQAEQAALKAVGGGTVMQGQRDRWKGYQTWEVTISQIGLVYDAYVDARSAAVLTVSKQSNGAAAGQKFITKVQAVRSTMQAVGGGRLLLVGLDTKDDMSDGSRDWSVDVKARNGIEYEAKVNALTGKVVAIKVGG